MKFSVLIPTRDRLEYLIQAVESVRRQDFEDWELIVSDNGSTGGVDRYVRSLGDSRIRYGRTPQVLSVTDNWNLALERSSGDYILMLGDDDFLLRGYLRTLDATIREFDAPDAIYTGAFLFTYPGVADDDVPGSLRQYGYADFLRVKRGREPRPRFLGREEAIGLVRDFFGFRARYGFNMQFALVARSFIESLAPLGSFFQSEFPDYYAMNMLMLRADRILALSRPLVVIGVTPKSYGFYHARRHETEGKAFLQGPADDVRPRRHDRRELPGSYINNGWLSALRQIQETVGPGCGFSINYRRYRFLQILSLVENQFVFQVATEADLTEMAGLLSAWERAALWSLSLIRFAPTHLRRRAIDALRLLLRQTPPLVARAIPGDFRTASDVFKQIDPNLY